MQFNFKRNTRQVSDIYRNFQDSKLKVDSNYQRRKVWNEEDKVRLIETILMGLLIPEVFFWDSAIDPDTGETITHIVDGQQRINAIVDFINNDFELKEKYLLDDAIKKQYANKRFENFSSDEKTIVWSYHLPLVEIDKSCTIDDIKIMFYRLNLTNYSLNQAEKLNSINSAFGDKCDALSTLGFWGDKKLFSSNDVKRMKDVEYCGSIYILAIEGIIDQPTSRKVYEYTEDYKDEFDVDNKLTDRITAAMDLIDKITDKATSSFISKKTQMYTLFSIAFKMIDKNIEYSEDFFERFKLFVAAYNSFRNEFTTETIAADLLEVFELIKKYKLASSEGINKITNRVIRFETLYKICIEFDDSIKTKLDNISITFYDLLKGKRVAQDKFEEDDLIELEEIS